MRTDRQAGEDRQTGRQVRTDRQAGERCLLCLSNRPQSSTKTTAKKHVLRDHVSEAWPELSLANGSEKMFNFIFVVSDMKLGSCLLSVSKQ